MGVHIAAKNTHSHPPSVTSEDEEDYHDELETASHAPSAGVPSPYSLHPQSTSGSSNHPSQFELHYPNEIPPHVGEIHPPGSGPRSDRRERAHNSRPSSIRRDTAQRRQHHPQTASRSRQRQPEPESSSESEDSTEDFIQKSEYDIGTGMPRPTSYYAPNGYTQSNSSGASYGYPPVPHSSQMVPYPPPHQPGAHPQYGHPQHAHHSQTHQAYPPVASPPPHGYPPNQSSHHPQSAMSYNPPSHAGHVAPPYSSAYGPPSIIQPYMPPVPASGYFPPGYGPPAPHQYPSQYHQMAPHLYAHQQMPPLPEYMNAWRTRSPHPGASVSSSSSDKPAAPAIDQEEIMKRFEALLTAKDDEKKAAEAQRQEKIRTAEDQLAAIRKAEQERQLEEVRIRAEALKAAHEQAEAAAKAQAQRAAEEARIRKEATEAAKEAIAAAAAAAAEQNAREARIREEAARAALEKAAADAQAKADQEAKEKKIAADAADAAKSSAEKAAAEAATAAQEAAKKEKEEAEQKLKEAEEASAKAKKEAEDAQAAAAAAKPPEKKAPVRFKDAIGRNYNFPFERCHKWRDMEGLIIQAFQHIQDLGQHVIEGRYDLIGPDKEIIMPEYWDVTVQPDMNITMMLWPIPEKEPEPELPHGGPLGGPPMDGVIDLDELLNPKKKSKSKNRGGIGQAFGNWMLGGAPSRPRKPAGKDIKKPEGAHRDAVEAECIVLNELGRYEWEDCLCSTIDGWEAKFGLGESTQLPTLTFN